MIGKLKGVIDSYGEDFIVLDVNGVGYLVHCSMPAPDRPPVLMMALHIWAMAHGIASLFGRGDAARRAVPMSPEDLLEAAVLVYLRGLGLRVPPDR